MSCSAPGQREVVVTIKLKGAYDPPSRGDGMRILVDRLWPRGVRKGDAGIDLWPKEIAPSPGLRTWFSHDPQKWGLFRKRYFAELDRQSGAIGWIVNMARRGTVTLVYGSKEKRYNNAVALEEYLEARMAAKKRKAAA
jgi:uncharacterized protein YeaO (DUF488 family)